MSANHLRIGLGSQLRMRKVRLEQENKLVISKRDALNVTIASYRKTLAQLEAEIALCDADQPARAMSVR